MKGEVIQVEKFFDSVECKYRYVVVVEFDELPDYKLGEVDL